jgi:hypothetical protein
MILDTMAGRSSAVAILGDQYAQHAAPIMMAASTSQIGS